MVTNSVCMPAISPSYSPGPITFENREYFTIVYTTHPEALRAFIPDYLYVNNENQVFAQWIHTKSHGIGDYSKLEILVPVTDDKGRKFLYEIIELTDSSGAITMGREVYGFPAKYALPQLSVVQDTVLGDMSYSGYPVVHGTMPFKESEMSLSRAAEYLTTPRLSLKLIPDEKGKPEIAQLVSVSYTNVKIHSAFQGRGRIHLVPHVQAPLCDLPVISVVTAFNIQCNLQMNLGRVEHDYLTHIKKE